MSNSRVNGLQKKKNIYILYGIDENEQTTYGCQSDYHI